MNQSKHSPKFDSWWLQPTDQSIRQNVVEIAETSDINANGSVKLIQEWAWIAFHDLQTHMVRIQFDLYLQHWFIAIIFIIASLSSSFHHDCHESLSSLSHHLIISSSSSPYHLSHLNESIKTSIHDDLHTKQHDPEQNHRMARIHDENPVPIDQTNCNDCDESD